MNRKPREALAPAQYLLPNAYFYDAWCIESDNVQRSALEHFIAAEQTPHWVDRCMSLRNRVVSYFGLKNLGEISRLKAKPIEEYQAGDRVGIFTLFENSFDEVLLGVKLCLLILMSPACWVSHDRIGHQSRRLKKLGLAPRVIIPK